MDIVAIFTVVGVHLENAPYAFFVSGGCVKDLAAFFEAAAVNPEIDEFSYVRISHDLEGQSRERLFVVGLTFQILFAVECGAIDGWNV